MYWPQDHAEVSAALRDGAVIAYPTEGVFGIGGDAANPAVATEVLRLKKGRDVGKGMVVVVSDWSQCAGWVDGLSAADFTGLDAASATRATTFILPASDQVPQGVRHRDGGIAIRRSSHPVVRALCACLGRPIISTSANLPGELPARSVAEVQAIFPDMMVIDAPLGDAMRPSRIVDWRSGQVLRD
ncbi:L-threonylcarbamoyladenylate synthase [Cardiobacteriaceae bacterium TAE3-ERU3]|nr:L-threonylcarbamoyladenylate synthase [Cardiobacteriaceae bacterium TAE3-ERU3]